MSLQPQTFPREWIRDADPSLLKLDSRPLITGAPDFPWEKIGSLLAKTFELDGLLLTSTIPSWRSEKELLEGIGAPVQCLDFNVLPLSGMVSFVMSEKEVALLMSWLLTKETKSLPVENKEFQEGFFKFVALEVLHIFSQVEFDKTLSLTFAESEELLKGDALTLDICLTYQNHPLWGRLLISPDLRASWNAHFSQKKVNTEALSPLAEKLEVNVHLEVGKVALLSSELIRAEPGDFILLDTCSAIPGEGKARVSVTVNGKPVFRARLKQNQLKILEFPLYHEVDEMIAKNDTEYDHSEDEESEDEVSDLEIEESSVDSEEESLEDSSEESVENSSEIEDNDDEESEIIEHGPRPMGKGALSTEDLPLSLVIELGRLKMSVKKLMELQPGNLLDLNMSPEDGVDLVVSGKIIGRGELIRLGDSVGVRILDLG